MYCAALLCTCMHTFMPVYLLSQEQKEEEMKKIKAQHDEAKVAVAKLQVCAHSKPVLHVVMH